MRQREVGGRAEEADTNRGAGGEHAPPWRFIFLALGCYDLLGKGVSWLVYSVPPILRWGLGTRSRAHPRVPAPQPAPWALTALTARLPRALYGASP